MLREEPFKGKRLERELSGYRSLRAQRFRIIYMLNEAEKIIEIHYVGHRKDVYELFAERAKERE
jgi:mRNA-degrading endonuclease RelE of RelBE toxin-antitoxin system